MSKSPTQFQTKVLDVAQSHSGAVFEMNVIDANASERLGMTASSNFPIGLKSHTLKV